MEMVALYLLLLQAVVAPVPFLIPFVSPESKKCKDYAKDNSSDERSCIKLPTT